MEIKAPFEAEQLRLDLDIDRAEISNAFANQAALYAWYASRFAEMLRQESRAKLMLDVVEASIDKRIRDEANSIDEKLTEPQIARKIRLDKKYIAAQQACAEAEAMAQLAKDACKALEHRRDMLVQMGARERAELQGDMVMRGTKDRVRDAVADQLKEKMSPAA